MTQKKQDYHHGDLRTALLEVAIDMIAEEGLDSLTLRALGQRIGVSRTAAYRHFADKSALLAAVSEEGFRMLHEALDSIREAGAADVLIMFQNMGYAYIQFALENPTHYRLMFGGAVDHAEHYPDLASAGQSVFDILSSSIEQCQKDGLVKAGDARAYAYVVWSTVHGLSSLLIDKQVHPEIDDKHLKRLTIESIIAGIGT